jgi:hypothetical protein
LRACFAAIPRTLGPVRTLEQIVEQIRAAAGADFAFVLSRKGRLCTRRAPQDMPELGRNRIVRAARPLLGTDRVTEMTMAREELVPYGGAAPVDVYFGVVAEQAIVCVVLASWADRVRAAPALESGMELIEPLLRRGLPAGRRSSPDLGPAKGVPYVPERVLPPMPPPLPRYASVPDIIVGEAPLGRESLIAVRREGRAGSSAPEISVGEAPLGRETLIAVEREGRAGSGAPQISLGQAPLGRETLLLVSREERARSNAPEISLGEAPLGRETLLLVSREERVGSSAPEISLDEAPLGRETLLAIDAEGKPRPTSSPEAIRVELVSAPELAELSTPPSGRATMPWVEPPEDTKRAADAAKLGRGLSPPRVTIKLEEADERSSKP